MPVTQSTNTSTTKPAEPTVVHYSPARGVNVTVTTDSKGHKSTDVDFKPTGPQSDYNSPFYKPPDKRTSRPLNTDARDDGFEVPDRIKERMGRSPL
jgi:hypothetical protein